MKLKHRLKRLLFPRKHADSIKKIRAIQVELKIVRANIAKYDRLAKHGILGDSLWDRYQQLIRAQEYGERMIKNLKEEYKYGSKRTDD